MGVVRLLLVSSMTVRNLTNDCAVSAMIVFDIISEGHNVCIFGKPVKETRVFEIPRKTPPVPEAAWARRLTHRPGPPRQTEEVLVQAGDYRTGEKAAGTSSLFSCRTGRTPVWGGHAPPDWRDASRTRVRSVRSL